MDEGKDIYLNETAQVLLTGIDRKENRGLCCSMKI
jgi:hypothetical protein